MPEEGTPTMIRMHHGRPLVECGECHTAYAVETWRILCPLDGDPVLFEEPPDKLEIRQCAAKTPAGVCNNAMALWCDTKGNPYLGAYNEAPE